MKNILSGGSRILKLFIFIIVGIVIWQFSKWLSFDKLNAEKQLPLVHEVSDTGVISSPVRVSVYYEALCPDSKSFIMKQLLPTFTRASRLMDVELIPYGKAETKLVGNSFEFKCQHSYVECEANKIHACSIYMIRDKAVLLKYISCMIADNSVPDEAGRRCANEFLIDYTSIDTCANGNVGSQLLKTHGDKTHALQPPAHFIPTVVFDDSQQIAPLPAILKNLLAELCRQFKHRTPTECIQTTGFSEFKN